MAQRLWNLTLTIPGEPERRRVVPQDEMVVTLRRLMGGELPADADLRAGEAREERFAAPVAHAA